MPTAYWEAAVSGRFFTRWSALVSLLVAVTLLVPVVPDGATGYAQGMLASFVAWCVLAVPVLVVAALERRLAERTVRGILVTGVIVAVAVARPFLNEAALHALFGRGSQGDFPARVATNVLVAVLLFSLVGVTTTQYQRARDSIARLDAALARSDATRRALEADGAEARALVGTAVADLRAARDEMLAGTVDFDTVSDYSDRVRTASHRFDSLAKAPTPAPPATTGTPVVRRARPVSALRPTPVLLVGAIYVLACIPFILSTGSLATLVIAIASSALMDAAATLILRTAARPDGRVRVITLIATWFAAGAFATGVATWLVPGLGLVLFVPLFAVPAMATVVAFAIDARHRARDDESDSTAALARQADALAGLRARTRAPLRHAASTLHGRVQGRCVIFAALVDDAPPSAAQIDGFRAETDRALDDVLRADGAADAACTGELDRVIDGWQPLLQLDTRIDAALASALARTGAAPLVGEVVNEALVNAVKHSGARAARIEITQEVAGIVRVRVSSAGQLPRPIVPTRSFGGHTLLYQDGADVVLESALPVAGSLARQV